MKRFAIIAMALMSLVAAGGCEAKVFEGSTWPHLDPDHDAQWTPYRDAFPVRDSWLTGPAQLIATGDGCFVGVGADSSADGGMVPAIWTANGDCSAPRLDRPNGTDKWLRGNITSLDSAVVANDGTFLALGQTAVGKPATYESFAVRGKTGSWWPPVTRFQAMANVVPDVVGPDVLIARPAGGFVAVGESGPNLFAWSSDDGISWAKSPIPVPAGMQHVQIVSAAAGPGGTIAVVGLQTLNPTVYQSQALAWFSTDRGFSWNTATVPADAGVYPTALIHDGKRFAALGIARPDEKSTNAWALTSADGATWHREPSLEPALARGFHTATALSDGRIAATSVGSGPSAQSPKPGGCASVFFLGGPSIIEERLGCNPIPTSIVQLNDGRLAASMGQHLWLRKPVSRE